MRVFTTLLTLTVLHASTLPIPSSGVYLGVWANPNSAGSQEAAIELLEGPSGINRPFALHLGYYGWSALSQLLNSSGVFQPDSNLQGDIDHGRVPVISWTCDRQTANSDHIIASGDPTEDAVITATAKALAQYPGPVLLRWFWEFNLLNANDGNQPCGNDNGTPTQQVYTDFIGAWQHIHQLFQNAGATNVIFLWNPGHYTDGNPNDPHGNYPGNEYVDWIGVDSYQRSQTETFQNDFNTFYSDFTANQYGGKPLMVGENASAAETVYNAELQPAYLAGFLADLKANMYPAIKAYDYFDAPGNAPDYWVLDAQGLSEFATLANSPSFLIAPHADLRRQRRDLFSRRPGSRLLGPGKRHGPEQRIAHLEFSRLRRQQAPDKQLWPLLEHSCQSLGRRRLLLMAYNFLVPSTPPSVRSNVPSGRCPALRATCSIRQSEKPSAGRDR